MPSMATTIKTKLSQRLMVDVGSGERTRADTSPLRSGIDEVDDRVLAGGVKLRWLEHQSIQIRLAVPRFHRDWHRRLPPGGEKLADIGLLDFQDLLAGVVPEDRDGAASGFE